VVVNVFDQCSSEGMTSVCSNNDVVVVANRILTSIEMQQAFSQTSNGLSKPSIMCSKVSKPSQ
jgi:hypothetical protein